MWLGSGSGLPQCGMVRWIGILPEMGSDWTVGIELVGTIYAYYSLVLLWQLNGQIIHTQGVPWMSGQFCIGLL